MRTSSQTSQTAAPATGRRPRTGPSRHPIVNIVFSEKVVIFAERPRQCAGPLRIRGLPLLLKLTPTIVLPNYIAVQVALSIAECICWLSNSLLRPISSANPNGSIRSLPSSTPLEAYEYLVSFWLFLYVVFNSIAVAARHCGRLGRESAG